MVGIAVMTTGEEVVTLGNQKTWWVDLESTWRD